MRALFAAAAVALSVTAVHAQEMKPLTPVAHETSERAIPPAAATPTSTLIEQLKAAGELKDPKTLEAPAPKIGAPDAKPVEPKSVQPNPAGIRPVEAAKPPEMKAVETKAAESRPAKAAYAKPAKQRAVRKRETDEQKARRIAAKYGVSW